jgi:hypothetical protein
LKAMKTSMSLPLLWAEAKKPRKRAPSFRLTHLIPRAATKALNLSLNKAERPRRGMKSSNLKIN